MNVSIYFLANIMRIKKRAVFSVAVLPGGRSDHVIFQTRYRENVIFQKQFKNRER